MPPESSSEDDERRVAPRSKVLEVCVYRHEGKDRVGALTSINENGAFLRVRRPLPVGSRVTLVFDLKDEYQVIEADGEVVNSHDPSEPEETRGMGIRFLELDEEQEKVIILLRDGLDPPG